MMGMLAQSWTFFITFAPPSLLHALWYILLLTYHPVCIHCMHYNIHTYVWCMRGSVSSICSMILKCPNNYMLNPKFVQEVLLLSTVSFFIFALSSSSLHCIFTLLLWVLTRVETVSTWYSQVQIQFSMSYVWVYS